MIYQPGDTILNGEYRIDAFIGAGAFAEVYRATLVTLNAPRALKVLRRDAPGLGSTEYTDFRERFRLEGRLGARLDHPHVIRVYDFRQEGDTLILVMELAAGGSLAERLARAQEASQPIGIAEAVRIGQEAAQGLAALHGLDAVHRDVKPSNILFDQQGRVKVSDLGLAQILHGPSQRSLMGSLAPRHPGTPGYKSPEQESTASYLGPASDIYSLGVVLFELLTGRSYRNLKPGTRLVALQPDAPAELDELVARMLAEDPKARPWDGAEAAGALGEIRQRLDANQRQAAEQARLQQEEAQRQAAAKAQAEAEAAERARLAEEVRRQQAAARQKAEAAGQARRQQEEERCQTEVARQFVEDRRRREAEARGRRDAEERAAAAETGVASPQFRSIPAASPRANVQRASLPRWLWPAVGGIAVLLVVTVVALIAANNSRRAVPAATSTLPAVMAQAVTTEGPTPRPQATTSLPPTVAVQPTATPAAIAAPVLLTSTARTSPMPTSTAPPTYIPTTTATPKPIPASTASPTPVPRPAFTVKESTINVRDGPDTVYQVIGTLRQGETYEITGRSQASDWWQFTYNGKRTWVSNSVVNANSQAARAPVVAAPPTPKPSPGIGLTMVSDKDGMTLVYVGAGEFLMGSADNDAEAVSNEEPQHKVYLDAYWIDQTEVTKEQYQRCVAAGKCPAQRCGGTEQGNHPVVCMNWWDAAAYCAWAGRRLPTEAEWEKAARGPDGRIYPWGSKAPDCGRLNYRSCVGSTSAVGSYAVGASPYGAFDMAGNVWEWVADWYEEWYYASLPAQNPTGSASGLYRVLRGGSYYATSLGDPRSVRAAYRHASVPEYSYDDFGFRCAAAP